VIELGKKKQRDWKRKQTLTKRQKTGKRGKGKDSGLFSQSGRDVHTDTHGQANIRDDEVTGRREELERGEMHFIH
jgi:hypothetical protein